MSYHLLRQGQQTTSLSVTEALSESRRVRRQRHLEQLEIPQEHLAVTEEVLGKGGFGTVYLADYNGRNAAAKVLLFDHDVAGPAGLDDEDMITREGMTPMVQRQRSHHRSFMRELESMTRLRSPHTIQVYGAITSLTDRYILVMELLSGGDLSTFLRRADEPLADENTRQIIRDICAGMTFLHSKQTIHGDLKSANVLLDGAGRAKVRDMRI